MNPSHIKNFKKQKRKIIKYFVKNGIFLYYQPYTLNENRCHFGIVEKGIHDNTLIKNIVWQILITKNGNKYIYVIDKFDDMFYSVSTDNIFSFIDNILEERNSLINNSMMDILLENFSENTSSISIL